MRLTDAGQSRVRGYLFVLGRSLRTLLPSELAADAVREVESHIRERVEQIEDDTRRRSHTEAAVPGRAATIEGERALVERVLAQLGPPLRVAQAYACEMTLDGTEATGRSVPIGRALRQVATTSFYGFAAATVVLLGWALGISLLTIAVLKPIFPDNVGLILTGGVPGPGLHVFTGPRFSVDVLSLEHGLTYGATFPLPAGATIYGGYWVIPISIVAALVVLMFTHRLSRRLLVRLRSRRSPGRLRLRVVVEST